MKVTAFELWLIRNDPEIQEAPKGLEVPIAPFPPIPIGSVLLVPHKSRCIALTGRDDKTCACAIVPDAAPAEVAK